MTNTEKILRSLLESPKTAGRLGKSLELANGELKRCLTALDKAGLITKDKTKLTMKCPSESIAWQDVAAIQPYSFDDVEWLQVKSAMLSIPHRLCQSIEQLRADVDRAIQEKLDVIVDFETSSLDTRWYEYPGLGRPQMNLKVAGFGYRFEGGVATYVPVGHRAKGKDANLNYREAAAELARLARAVIPLPLSDAEREARPLTYAHHHDTPRLVFHHARFDLDVLEHFCGVDVRHPDAFVDTMIRHHLLWPSMPHGLKDVAHQHVQLESGDTFVMAKLGSLDYWEPLAGDEADSLGEYDEENYVKARATMDFTLVDPTDPETLQYPCADVEATFRLEKVLRLQVRCTRRGDQRLDDDGLPNHDLALERLDKSVVGALRRIERWRWLVDVKEAERLTTEYDKRGNAAINNARDAARAFDNDDFNPNSCKQLSRILYDVAGVPITRRSKPSKAAIAAEVRCDGLCSAETVAKRRCKCSRSPSTDKKTLQGLAGHSDVGELCRHVLDFKACSKVVNTYLARLLDADDLDTVRVSFSPFKVSGRFSAPSRKIPGGVPIHGYPKGKKTSIPLRHLFLARPGYVLLAIDFKAQEMRLVAQLSQEPFWMASLSKGDDPHIAMAEAIWTIERAVIGVHSLNYIDAFNKLRDKAKGVLFAIIYGSSADGIAGQLGCSAEEAERIVDVIRSKVPTFLAWDQANRQKARAHGYVRDGFGRRLSAWRGTSISCAPPQVKVNLATNLRVQGTGASIMRLALRELDEEFERRGWNASGEAKILASIHDELVFEVSERTVYDAAPIIEDCMLRRANRLCKDVPMAVDISGGPHWAAEQKINFAAKRMI